MKEQAISIKGEHLTADHTILNLLNHPAFAGFGPLFLSWNDRTYDDSLRLRNVGSLLPYHSHVDPGTAVSALNHMIDDVINSTTVFYNFHTEEEQREQPTKSNTGLFFLRGNPERPLRSYPRVEAFPMSAPSMTAFPMPWRSASTDSTPSC